MIASDKHEKQKGMTIFANLRVVNLDLLECQISQAWMLVSSCPSLVGFELATEEIA
jgi:hypothetical protein